MLLAGSVSGRPHSKWWCHDICFPLLAAEHSPCKAPWSGTPCRVTSAHSRTMSPLDSTWKPGFSLATCVLGALETLWQLRYINLHLPYRTVPCRVCEMNVQSLTLLGCLYCVFRVFTTATELPLTDEDRAQMERWNEMQQQQQQQQDGVGKQLPCFSTVSAASSDITTTAAATTTTAVTTTTTTAGDMGPLRLSSADSRLADRYLTSGQMWSPLTSLSSADIASCLPTTAAVTTATATAGDTGPLRLTSADSRHADQCLANTGIIWRPLISLSSADITGCLQTAAGVDDDNDATTITRQRSFAGYGVGEIIPSLSDRYVLSFHCIHCHWSVIAVNSLSVLRLLYTVMIW